MNVRKIIHVDMDAFYASVEQRDRPELKGRPVVVGGNPKSRGVVASCSYEARKFGIRSAISSAQAHRLCPHAVFVPPDIGKYREVGHQIREMFYEITPLVEPLSLDEAYLDVTTNSMEEPLAQKIAEHLRKRIREELHLTASAGVGPNKFIAKVASDYRKPDGLMVVPPERVLDFVAKLPVERFWGVGPKTAERLHAMGLFTALDLRKRTAEELERMLGKFGTFLHGLSFGEDSREVDPSMDSKSCGSETTFDGDILDLRILENYIEDLASDVSSELKKMERPGRTVTLKLKYSDFKVITRSHTFMRFTDDARLIAKAARTLLTENTEAGKRPARLIGVSVSNLIDYNEPIQLWLDLPEDFA